MYKTNNQQSYLKFPYKLTDSSIKIRRLNSLNHYEARVFNYTLGGLHLKTQVFFEPGTHLYLNFNSPLPKFKGFNLSAMSYGLVVWCKKTSSESKFKYDLNTKWGFQTCTLCNAITRMDNIHITTELTFLCPQCWQRLETMPGSRIKQSLNRQFLGNVL